MLGDYFIVCKCHCHTSDNVKHIMACCFSCPTCNKDIKTVFYNSHKKECKEEQDKLIEKWKQDYENNK